MIQRLSRRVIVPGKMTNFMHKQHHLSSWRNTNGFVSKSTDQTARRRYMVVTYPDTSRRLDAHEIRTLNAPMCLVTSKRKDTRRTYVPENPAGGFLSNDVNFNLQAMILCHVWAMFLFTISLSKPYAWQTSHKSLRYHITLAEVLRLPTRLWW